MLKIWVSKFVPSSSTQEAQETLLNEQEDTATFKKSNDLLIYWIYFSYGVAMLLPWNVFITASDYFSYRFRGSVHEEDFQNYFSAYGNVSNLLSLALLLWLRQRKITSTIDVLIPLSINLVIFLFFTVTSLIAAISADFYFKITIACMAIAGFTTSLLQLTVFADASQLPPKYTQAVMSGQGIAGVSVALFSLLTTLLGGDGTFYYFSCAFVVTMLSMVGRFFLHLQPSYRIMMEPSSDIDMRSFHDEIPEPVPLVSIKDIVLDKSRGYICTVIYLYIITLALFPSITTQIKSVNGISPSIFISLHFLIFNVGDWIGRTLPIWKSCQVLSSRNLFICALLRTFFIPLFLSMSGSESNDSLFFVSVLCFAMSNGWLTSLVFMAAPRMYERASKGLVGSIMSFSLVVGLALGGLCSFLMMKIIS